MAFSLGVFLLGGAALEGMVYLPNWFHNVPDSLVTTRQFLAVRTPGNFFQLFAPMLVLISLMAVAIGWRHRGIRWALLAGLLLLAAAEIMTFTLVYPNIRIVLSEDVATRPVTELRQASRAFFVWGFWVRVPITTVAVCFYLYAARRMTLLRGSSSEGR